MIGTCWSFKGFHMDVFSALQVIFCLLGYCLFFSERLKIEPEFSPLFVVSLIMSCLLIGLMLNQLQITAHILFYAGFLFYFLFLYNIQHDPKRLFKRYFSCGLIIYGILLLLSYLRVKNNQFIHWDEFSGWGPILQHLYHYHTIPLNQLRSRIHISPNIASGLFNNYILVVFGSYSDGVAYFAQNILTISALLSVFLIDKIIQLLQQKKMPMLHPFESS